MKHLKTLGIILIISFIIAAIVFANNYATRDPNVIENILKVMTTTFYIFAGVAAVYIVGSVFSWKFPKK
jgi:hypothetical protein